MELKKLGGLLTKLDQKLNPLGIFTRRQAALLVEGRSPREVFSAKFLDSHPAFALQAVQKLEKAKPLPNYGVRPNRFKDISLRSVALWFTGAGLVLTDTAFGIYTFLSTSDPKYLLYGILVGIAGSLPISLLIAFETRNVGAAVKGLAKELRSLIKKP